MDDWELGRGFWLWVVGVSLAIGIGGMILFLLIGAVWYAWGFVGALVFFSLLFLGAAYVHDRRHQKAYEDQPI
jgi:membrane protein implicated in regulation of membrane protease activity